MKYGVNVEDGDLDKDGYGEILTGAGPGASFAPQVRGWNVDGGAVTNIAKVNFNAFSSIGYGVNVAGGDADGDGFAEAAAAPGPGPTASFPSEFRGFDYDASAIAPLPGFDVTPFATLYGGRVGLADLWSDGKWDLIAGAGRDPAADAIVDSYGYTGSALTPNPGSGFLPFASMYGVNVAGGVLGYY